MGEGVGEGEVGEEGEARKYNLQIRVLYLGKGEQTNCRLAN